MPLWDPAFTSLAPVLPVLPTPGGQSHRAEAKETGQEEEEGARWG